MDILDSNHLIPGTPTFFPALLAQIRDLALPSLPLDAVVFHSILRCLIAGEKHLLLRAPEQDVRLVVKLAFLTLSSVFGLPTHKLKIRPRSASPVNTSGTPFLRSLFLPWTAPVESQDEALPATPNSVSRKRNRNNATWARTSSTKPHRSMSNPNELHAGTTRSNPFGDSHEYLPSTSSSGANPFSTAPRRSKARVPLPHAFSDPTPLRPRLDGTGALQPRALVISGLENATVLSQRALTRVLAEKRVVLDDEDGDEVWNLPEGFIMVYVCPIDPHERPAIHKTLLDKFAMSATVSPHHSIRALLLSPSRNSGSFRNSPAIHTSPLPPGQVTPTSSPPFLAQPLPHHNHSLPIGLHHHQHHVHHPFLYQQALVPPTLLHDLRATYHCTYVAPALSVYSSDLFSAARHHPQLDGTLLTAKAMKDAIELARAGRVIGGDLTGIELVREDAVYAATKVASGNGDAYANREGEGDQGDMESPATTPLPMNGNGNALPHRYQPIEVVVEEVDGSSTSASARVPHEHEHHRHTHAWQPEVLEVSEADIARIAPRVMTHRLRVRDGPDDEVLGSAMFPAVAVDYDCAGDERDAAPEGTGRTTIKEILVQILAEV